VTRATAFFPLRNTSRTGAAAATRSALISVNTGVSFSFRRRMYAATVTNALLRNTTRQPHDIS
jgi:hypothetical protein